MHETVDLYKICKINIFLLNESAHTFNIKLACQKTFIKGKGNR